MLRFYYFTIPSIVLTRLNVLIMSHSSFLNNAYSKVKKLFSRSKSRSRPKSNSTKRSRSRSRSKQKSNHDSKSEVPALAPRTRSRSKSRSRSRSMSKSRVRSLAKKPSNTDVTTRQHITVDIEGYTAYRKLLEREDDTILSAICSVPISSVTHFLGPISLSIHRSDKYRKIVVIMGEQHENAVKCPPQSSKQVTMEIDAFFRCFPVQYPNRMYDIMLESAYRSALTTPREPIHALIPNTVYIGDIEQRLAACLDIKKGSCPLGNLRVHYVDVREH